MMTMMITMMMTMTKFNIPIIKSNSCFPAHSANQLLAPEMPVNMMMMMITMMMMDDAGDYDDIDDG